MSDSAPAPKTPVHTIWIWLLILLPLVGTAAEWPFAALFIRDYTGVIGDAMAAVGPRGRATPRH